MTQQLKQNEYCTYVRMHTFHIITVCQEELTKVYI